MTVAMSSVASAYTPLPQPTTNKAVVVPTPEAYRCPTPGTYTFPAKTVTVHETTTVCAASSTSLAAGTHVVGGVTTAVEMATTITCPVATVSTSGSMVVSTVVMTRFVCPSAGTYTIAPMTTTVTSEAVVLYPVPTSYGPGTYTAPEQVVTATETDFVTYCPYTRAGLPTGSATNATVATSAVGSATAAPTPALVKIKVQPAASVAEAAPSSSPSEETKQAKVPMKPGNNLGATKNKKVQTGGLRSNNDQFGITYTPYEASNGQCKSEAQVDADIGKLKGAGFGTIRVYSTDCRTLDYVGKACQKYGMGMIVGVFVKETGCSYEAADVREQIDELAAWDLWHLVKLVVVGNEAIMNGHCSTGQLQTLLRTVKAKCSSYHGPYTISETLNIWQRAGVAEAMCGLIDVTGANVHPYFNPTVAAEAAGDFVQDQLERLAAVCPGKEAINLECGWPTSGSCNGMACPGPSQQQTAIRSIRAKTGSKTVFFSLENDLWKEAGSCGCEQSWGVAASFSITL